MVNKQFGDFDHSASDEEIESPEQARGDHRSNRNTPAKMSSRGFDSLYDITPPTGRSRRSLAAETGSLRRDAQIRRASRNDLEDTVPLRSANMRNSPAMLERKRASLAQVHAKVSEDESSLLEERPPTVTLASDRSRRWGGNSRNRQAPLNTDGAMDASPRFNTTPRSRPSTAQNPTAQSFILPDLPNLTELVSGVFEDGTPVFSKTAPPRSRFGPSGKGGNGRQPAHIPIHCVPIPQDEKAIISGLQLLQDKVALLENECAEAEKKIEEQELEIIELKTAAQIREGIRRSDSGLGSTDGEGSGKSSWKVEKTREFAGMLERQTPTNQPTGLEATVQTLRTKLDRTERKAAVTDIEKKRLSSERDNMASQLGVAFQTCEELKAEKQALVSENDILRQEVDTLRADNEVLRDELEHEQGQHREETIQLRRQLDQTENATQRQNITLQAELNHVRAQNDDRTQQLARKETELRKVRQEQVEYGRLKADHETLKSQLAGLKAKREEDLRRWSDQEASLKKMVDRRDETIRLFQDNTQDQTNEAMRLDNQRLHDELAQLAAQHEEDHQRWAHRERELNRKIRMRTDQRPSARRPSTADDKNVFDESIQRNSSHRREENTRTRIRNRVQEELRATRANASFQSSHIEVSPQKSYANLTRPSHRATLPTGLNRSVSAPVPIHKDEAGSDAESTTDISLAPRGTPFNTRSGSTPKLPTTTVHPLPEPDYTELSYIDSAAIAQLRRELEQERAAARGRAVPIPSERTAPETVRTERVVREDTVRSVASTKSARQSSLPRKSSLKDTTKTNMTQFEEDVTGNMSNADHGNEETQTKKSCIDDSMLSNTSRRRRSAPTEMTSAFIVPDLKIEGRKQSTIKIDITQTLNNKQHDNDNCTVCRRESANPDADALRVPKLVPVSTRMPDDVDATLRPARSPKEALALVVKELQDERYHLHAELAVMRAMLEAHDASMGRKKRVAIETAINEILAKIKVKDDQIYNLYDVLEGQQDHDITEQFVEEATEQIRAQDAEVEKKSRGKKVTIQSFHEDEEDDISARLSMNEDELPWEGFESSGEHNFTSDAVRVGVY